MDNIGEGCLVAIVAWLFIGVFTFVSAAIAQWLWGLIAVDIFNLPMLTYWQMFGLMWLVRLILPNRFHYSSKKD